MAEAVTPRESAIAMVQKIMDGDCYNDAEIDRTLEALDRGLGCPSGYVSDLIYSIYSPDEPEPTAAEVVELALAHRPFAL
ncbi:e9imm peptide [Streptomyces sp. NBC_00853]|uniref:e9imm peptide n=1 Tax=Streptomyces sp. NBC_00853 TaxID=2903681 RepID=UPI0038735167